MYNKDTAASLCKYLFVKLLCKPSGTPLGYGKEADG